ncbi:hypothetical protein QR680_016116 [Steinernema hermaphroditum]|uniref:Uncharacterized protein n=1 Tax=Steinernema hermaphroditum TaxID=289476 RepID=A0AA39LM24_9BILA|nr:hypothetical protein QR680_016116 [Steinernema hermaphroditum]
MNINKIRQFTSTPARVERCYERGSVDNNAFPVDVPPPTLVLRFSLLLTSSMDTSQFLLRADLRSVEYPRKLEAIQRFLKETPDYFAGNSFVQAVLVVDASHIVVTPIHDPAAPDVDDLVLMAAQFLLSTSHISKPAEDERREKNKLKLEVSRLRSLMGKIDVEKSAMDKTSKNQSDDSHVSDAKPVKSLLT